MTQDTGQHAVGGYPPAAGATTHATDERDTTADRPFASLTTRDYVTDAVAAVLLLVSLSLTWRLPDLSVQTGSDVAWALPATVLALAALTLPYLARLGAFPRSWSVHTTKRWRLLLTAPFALAALAQIVLDAIPGDRIEGVGAAVAVGLAGAVLAASPRSSEVGPREVDPSGARFGEMAARVLTFVALAGLLAWLVYFIVGWTQLSDRSQDRLGGASWMALTLVAVLALVAIVFIPLVLGALGRGGDWRRVLITVGIAAVVLFFVQDSTTNLFAKFETLRTWRFEGFPVIATGFGLVLLPAAAAALAAPAVSRARRAGDEAGSWFRTARTALGFHAVVALLLTVASISALVIVDDLAVAPQVAHVVILLVSGVLSLVAASALRKDVVERRGTVLVLTVLAAVAGITAMSQVASNDGVTAAPVNVLTLGYLLVALALPLLVVVALTAPTAVRAFFADHPRAERADGSGAAYLWRAAPKPAAHETQGYGSSVPQGAPAGGYGTPAPAAAAPEAAYPPPAAGYGSAPTAAEPAPASTQPVVVDALHEPAAPVEQPVASPPDADHAEDHDTVLKADRAALASDEAHVPAADTTAVLDVVDEPLAPAPVVATHGFTAEQAADPATSAHTLAQIVQDAPELRAAVASNPTTYPALLEWLGQLGDPDVDAALKSRQG